MSSHPSDKIADNLDALFATPIVSEEHQANVDTIVQAARTFADAVVANSPDSTDRERSLASVRDACDRAISAAVHAPPVVEEPILPP